MQQESRRHQRLHYLGCQFIKPNMDTRRYEERRHHITKYPTLMNSENHAAEACGDTSIFFIRSSTSARPPVPEGSTFFRTLSRGQSSHLPCPHLRQGFSGSRWTFWHWWQVQVVVNGVGAVVDLGLDARVSRNLEAHIRNTYGSRGH